MKGSEVSKALEEGKRLRIQSWRKGSYVELNENGMLKNQSGESLDLYAYALFTYEWEEYINNIIHGTWVKKISNDGLETIVYCGQVDTEAFDDIIFNYLQEDLEIKRVRLHKSEVEEMTEEEINIEKERWRWSEWGRKLNEWKVGDVFITDEYKFPLIVLEVEFEGVIESDGEDFAYDQMTMVCPVEMRQDSL